MAGRPANLWLLALVFVATVFLYSLHRVVGLQQLEEELGERHNWAKKHRLLSRGIPLVAAMAGFTIAAWAPLSAVLLLLPAGGVAMGYSIPFIPGKDRWLRLRDLPGAKVFLIAAVIAYVTVFVPLIGSGENWIAIFQNMGPWWMHRFLYIIAITIPFDIRDFDLDRTTGLKTFPTVLGIGGARIAALVALIGFSLQSWDLVEGLPWWPFSITAVVLLPLILLAHPKKSEFYFSLLLEGTIVLQWGLVWLALSLG